MNSKNTLNDGVLLELSISWTQALNMSDIKLTYFNGRGRAETSRLILAYAGQKYEDCRISFEDMAKLKPTLPYGQLPLLEYKGTTITQSLAIARFLAHEFGLGGKTPLIDANIDEVVDAITDFQNSLYSAKFEKDEKIKMEKIKKVREETIPTTLTNLEKLLVKRGGQYFAGNQFSWAELHFLQIMDLVIAKNEGVCIIHKVFFKSISLFVGVRQIPKIKQSD